MCYNTHMIFLIHGEESFLSHQQLSDTKKRFLIKNPDGYNLSVFDCFEIPHLETIFSSLHGSSLFSSKTKLTILKDFFATDSSCKDAIFNFLNDNNLSKSMASHVIFFESKDISKNAFYKKIKPLSSETRTIKSSVFQIEKWATKKFQDNQIQITPQQVNILIRKVGNDLWRLDSEIEKLISWTAFLNVPTVSDNDIITLTSTTITENVFNTVEAIANGDTSLSLKLIADHLEKRISAIYIFSMIAFQFRTLIKIKSAIGHNVPINALAKKTGIHPYTLQKSLRQLSRFSMEDLKNSFKKILDAETKIKSGKNPAEVLYNFVLKI
ncbi:DNA polymerase III subunit delta [bacterium]|nr:MAG: DNA polymerase III subunit delta [bacterium]